MTDLGAGNRFLVSLLGDRVLILRPPEGPMTAEQALNLAAWLVAVADPTLAVFPAILEAAIGA